MAVDEHRRRGGAGVDPGGRRHAGPAADDERRRPAAGGDGDDQRSRPPVRGIRSPHARNDAAPRSGDRRTLPRRRNADRPAQGPRCNDRPSRERNVPRDRTPCPRHRRDRRSSGPRDRGLLPEAKARHGRSRSHARAGLRSRRPAIGRRQAPGRPAARERTGFPAHRQAMTSALAALARRWIGGFVVLAAVVAGMPTPTTAQQADSHGFVDPERIGRLIRDGRNVDAIDLAKRAVAAAPPRERQFVYELAGWVCRVTLDIDCTRDILAIAMPDMQALLRTPGADRSSVSRNLLLMLPYQVATGDYQGTARSLAPDFIAEMAPAGSEPLLFAELQLLAAQRARRVSDFEASRDHLDKALIATFSLTGSDRSEVRRLLVRIIAQFLENYDVERALRLLAAADPLLKTISSDSFLGYEFLWLRAQLMAYGRDYAGAAKVLQHALSKLDRLQLGSAHKLALQVSAYNDLLGLEVLRGSFDTARDLLKSHPLTAAKAEILARGHFADGNEFNFALAEEFVRVMLGDGAKTGWGDLMTKPPRWTKDPEEIVDVQAFGQAAIGLQLATAGRIDEARRDLVSAARRRLAVLREQYRKSIHAAPLPRWADIILADFAIEATLAQAVPDYDLIIQASALLNRTIATSADDALTSQAIQASDDGKRTTQSLQTIQYQQAAWEKTQMLALTKRVLSSDEGDREVLGRERQRILYVGNEFTRQLQRIRAALTEKNGAVDTVASLATVRQVLLADEALILHAPIFGRIGKVCIRADSAQSSTQAMDSTARTDGRLLMAALTAAHPASNEADSQFPATQAVRLAKLMFGGLEDCLHRSPRVYLVSSPDTVEQVPPAALLAEMPPVLGNGYDLRAARWLIRDHAFVRTSSINAFVAAKRLSGRRSATLDYLGVGDPVLAPGGNPLGPAMASRGGLSSLQELPETADEVQRVASLFDKPKARLLRRRSATEENFRLQPLSEFDIVHLATHGLIREELPGLAEPSLVFTPRPGGDILNDGLLTASQIATLPLRARLVVQSACNSARYEPSVIDSGIQGLSTSFAIAGVPSMIAALWPIESALARDLIIDTFRTARGGNVAIADAMAMAVRRHLDGPTPRPLLHPRFWAALVVLGDGSVGLNASAQAAKRELGPFANVDSAERASIVSVAPLDADFVSSALGHWMGKTFESFIRRKAADGAVRWEVKDQQIGAGPVAATEQTIYAGGYLPQSAGASTVIVPMLRGLQPDGKVLWTQRLPDTPEDSAVMGLAIAQDQSAVALVGPVVRQKAETDFSLVRVDGNGREIARKSLALTVYGQGLNSGYLRFEGAAGLAVVNRGRWAKSGPDSYRLNGLGDAEQCWEGDAADIVLLDVGTLDERKRLRIDRFQVEDAVSTDDGWIVVGDSRDACSTEVHAAAYIVKNDGSVQQLWRDASPFPTSARGIRRAGGTIEIIGYAERAVAIREDVPTPKERDFGSRRSGNEAYISGQLFSVHLSAQGVEEGRDFVAAGLPTVPMGMVSTADRSVIFGTIGSRPLWLNR
ncbi:MAG: CHAT domain-containing protein [Rhodospirillales bacterium]|nr:CHAT domain-containing protein [Rhodospirillales bacterium]